MTGIAIRPSQTASARFPSASAENGPAAFELDLTHSASSLVRRYPGQHSLALLLEVGLLLGNLDRKDFNDAGRDVLIVEPFEVGIATDGTLADPATHASLLPRFKRRRLVRFLFPHRPSLRNDPAAGVA